MSDITLMRGYGFPRGSAMDYAGYGDIRGIMAGGPTTSRMRIRNAPEANTFAPIPALDGIFCEEGYGPVRFGGPNYPPPIREPFFGSGIDVSMGPITLDPTEGYYGPAGLGPDGLVHYPNGATCDPSSQSCPGYSAGGAGPNAGGALFAWGLLALGAFLWMNR